MRLSDETYEFIKQEVANMYINYDIKGIPISSFEVATKIGLTVIPYSALTVEEKCKALEYSVDGYSVEENDGSWIIYYNDIAKDYRRINHTIMHEIGHYILGHIKEGEEEESEAKFFAKYALASPALIHNMKTEVNIENIMDYFEISHKAAVIALDNYNKWLRFGPFDYVVYERQMLIQLEIDIA